MMKIGVIGAGNIGGTLSRLWAEKGHEIMLAGRDDQSPKIQAALKAIGPAALVGSIAEAVAFGEAVLLAVPGAAVQEVIQQGGDWTGKIVIDATNRLGPTAPDSLPSVAEDIDRWADGVKVVKAFNTTGVANMAKPQFGSQQADMFICGDDEAAKAAVAGLAQAIGFEVVDCGPLANAALLEALAKLWIQLAYPLGNGPDIAFKLLRR
jgi:predicted dinucleotide-binding enzyme